MLAYRRASSMSSTAAVGAGAALCSHPDVGALSFTGGTATGAAVAAAVAPRFAKLSLELGGKNALIVLADVNV